MRRLTGDEIMEAIDSHEKYREGLRPGIGELDKQRLQIADMESKGLRCPLCTGYALPFIARAAYYAGDRNFDPRPKQEGVDDTAYTCPNCGTQLHYTMPLYAGNEHWSLQQPTIVELHLRSLVDLGAAGEAIPHAKLQEALGLLHALREIRAETKERASKS